MINRLLPVFLAGLIISLSSCLKEDEKVPAHIQGNVKTDTVAMGSDYRYQVYFDLTTGSNSAANLKTDWDLGFDCGDSTATIILNTSNFMMAAEKEGAVFGSAMDTTGLTWGFDKSDGNPDSMVFKNWITPGLTDTMYSHKVYIVNRGMDAIGNPRGFKQITFDKLDQGTYTFRFANLDGSNQTSFSVTKDPSRNYLNFSFAGGGQIKTLEPPKNSWDLLFTQYTSLLFTDLGQAYPYLVTGVLINKNGVEVAVDSTSDFQTLTYEQATNHTFSKDMDKIGYLWKFYSFETGSYTVNTKVTYIIKDTEGFVFKLRFIGFYNTSGEKGHPVFEYQQL